MIFDIEANGLEDATRIHCMAYEKDGEIFSTTSYKEMRQLLENAKVLIGHNIILYDIPTIERILNIKITARLIDTLGLSWVLHPNRHIYGLESYGEYYGVKKPEIDDWENLTPEEYCHRCEEDVKINSLLWDDLKDKLLDLYDTKKKADRFINYISFKLDCALEQARSKWKLNVEDTEKYIQILTKQQDEKLEQLIKVMPPVKKMVKKTKPAKPFKKDGTWSVHGAKWFALLKERGLPKDYNGEVEVLQREEEPNPNSTEQVKNWLYSMGWVPESFDYKRDPDTFEERKIPQIRIDGDDGKELCPSVIKLIDENPEVELLNGLTLIQHRLSIFKGFINNQKDGYLIADINGFTNTLRFKHKVLVNLPGVDKPWGKEIRGVLIAPDGYILCGSDMCSLEDNTKKHYMYDYDPDFVKEMSVPGFDPHLDLAKFANVVTQKEIDEWKINNPEYKWVKGVRKNYKVTNYSATYGVKPPKLSRTTGLPVREAKKLLDAFWERNWAILKVAENTEIKYVGTEMWLYNPVSGFYYSLRNKKDVFSTLNQGTGVFCFDSWIREFRNKRSQLTGQFHDEIIACLKEGYEERYEKLLKDSIKAVNEKLKLNVKLDVDVQFGKTYADIH